MPPGRIPERRASAREGPSLGLGEHLREIVRGDPADPQIDHSLSILLPIHRPDRDGNPGVTSTPDQVWAFERESEIERQPGTVAARPFEGGFIQILDEVQPAPDGGNFQLDSYGGMRMYNLPLSLVFGANRSGVPVSESPGIYFGGGGSASKIMGLGGSAPAHRNGERLEF